MTPQQTAPLSIPDPRTSVVGGVRVSTDQQADQYGPDRQRADVERDAERNGLSIVHWVEESISGANHDRAAENEYYALARRFHGLNFMFSHPNRVGRHVEVIVGIARQIHQLGGTVWIAGLGNLRDGRNWRYFLRDAAEAETDYLNVVDQLYRGKRGKAMRGKWPHGAPPWGYVLERDEKGRSTRPVPNPVTAPVVKRVADLAETVGGESKSLAVILEEGWPAPTAAGWSIRSIHNILKNERYTGRAVFGGIELLFEPIIPREQFERIQKLRAARRRESGPKDTGMLLAGFTRCAECGAAIGRGSSLTPYARYTYYCCWKSKRPRVARKDGGCTNTRNWQPPVLDALCWDALVRHLTRPAELRQIIAPAPPPVDAPPPARVTELEEAIARAWEPFAAGKYSMEMAERLATPFQAQLDALKAEYAPARSAPVSPDLSAHAAHFALALSAELDMTQKRRLMTAVEARFYIGPTGLERLTIDLPTLG